MRRAVLAVVVAACSGPGTPMPDAPPAAPVHVSLTTVPRRLVANGRAHARLSVRVVDDGGNPVAGRTVTLSADGAGEIVPASGVTDANGLLAATFASTEVTHRTFIAKDLDSDEQDDDDIDLDDPCAAPHMPGSPGIALARAVAGDFDNDHNLDVVGVLAGGLAFAAGNGDGSFQPVLPIAGSVSGPALAAGDFDGDGNLDIATATPVPTLAVMRGNGDGSFGALIESPMPARSYVGPLVTGDFDGDGKLDVAVLGASDMAPQINVMYGNGDATFAGSMTPSGASPNNTPVMVAADLDGDQITDLVSSDYYSAVATVHRGHANRTFDPGQDVSLGGGTAGVGAMTAADLDHDGHIDLAIARYTPSSTTVLLNTGSGGFATPRQFAGGNQGRDIVAIDTDHDNALDLVFTDGAKLYVAKGDGAGNFGAPTATTTRVSRLVAGDFTGTGLIDLFIDSSPSYVVRARASGLALPDLLIDPVAGIAVADVDTDGIVDLVTIPTQNPGGGDVVQIRRGTGGGAFTLLGTYPIGSTWQSTATIIAADLDGDLDTDLVIAGVLDVTVLTNNGSGTFQSSTMFSIASGARHRGLAVADFDHDGRQDIAVTTEAWVASTATLSIAYRDANGTYDTRDYPLHVGTFWLEPADLNGDVYPDLVTAGQSPMYSLLGGPRGAVAAPTLVYSGGGLLVGGAVAADLDQDGHTDIVASMTDLASHRGHGDGTFDAPKVLTPGEIGNPHAVVDLNGDARPDVLAGDYGDVNVVTAYPDGTYSTPLRYPTGSVLVYARMIPADVDGNGLVDIVTTAGILLHRSCEP